MDEAKILQGIEIAKNTGKIRLGTNEATKAIERSKAKVVVIAEDVNPKEVTMHIPPLCDEKKISCFKVKTKQELGRAAGLGVPTAAIAIVELGDAKFDSNLKPKAEPKVEEKPKEEKKPEPKIEEPKEEKKPEEKKEETPVVKEEKSE